MQLEKLFRGLILLQILSAIALIFVVPIETETNAEPMLIIGITLAALILFILWLVSLFLLFRFAASGRIIFVAVHILGIPLGLLAPETTVPTSNLYDILVWFGGLIDGAMLAMMYLTSLSARFQKG